MPLINSLNDDRVKKLKNLKYPGRAPYIKKDINNPGPNSSGQLQARAEDVVRLANMITDTPGVSFLANQALLENSTAKSTGVIARAQEVAGGVLRRLGTMAKQIPVNGTGTHFSYVDNKPELTYFKDGLAAPSAVAGTPIKRPSDVVTRFEKIAEKLEGGASPEEKRLPWNQVELPKNIIGWNGLTRTGDAINLLDVGEDTSEDAFDLVPVKVKNILTGSGLLVFRGFIANLSDSYTGEWGSTQYVGRMEKFFNYTGFNRTLSFTLTIPIFSVGEQAGVYKKLNSLVSYTAPSYKNYLPQGIIAELQIGDYIKSAGVFNSINLTYANDVPWGGHEGNGGRILPQVITVQINFTPIHDRAPEYNEGRRSFVGHGDPASDPEATNLVYVPTTRYEPVQEEGSLSLAGQKEAKRQAAEEKARQARNKRVTKKVQRKADKELSKGIDRVSSDLEKLSELTYELEVGPGYFSTVPTEEYILDMQDKELERLLKLDQG